MLLVDLLNNFKQLNDQLMELIDIIKFYPINSFLIMFYFKYFKI